MLKKLLPVIACIFSCSLVAQKIPDLALTPPMGWNSWNTFQTNINEQMIHDMADVMVSSGMKDAGYTYIVLDDGWMKKARDSSGNLVADPVKFPSGMKALADYLHAKGLKLGLYNCAGTKTCAGYPGTHGYEDKDAKLYASFGIDYFKYDWCFTDGIDGKQAYITMSQALRKAGRPIVFSLCEWGVNHPWLWAKDVGHLWRTTADIYNCFDCVKAWNKLGVLAIIDMQDSLRRYAGPDHWNDPDMLEVGNGMTTSEDRAHFSMWCMLAAPLMAGNDLRKMSAATAAILTNKDAIAIGQDKAGIQGFLYNTKDSIQTWIKPLSNGDIAVCFLNRSIQAKPFMFNWAMSNIKDTLTKTDVSFRKVNYLITDVWSRQVLGNTSDALKISIPAHDVLMVRLRKLQR